MNNDNIELLKKKIIMGLSEKEAFQIIKEHVKLCKDKETGNEILIRAAEVLLYRSDLMNKVEKMREENKLPRKLSKKDFEGLNKEELLRIVLSPIPTEVLLEVVITKGSIMARFEDSQLIVPCNKVEEYLEKYRQDELNDVDVDELVDEVDDDEDDDEDIAEDAGHVQMMSMSDFMNHGFRRPNPIPIEKVPWDRILQNETLITKYLSSPNVPLQKKFRFGLEVFIHENSKSDGMHGFIELAKDYSIYLDTHPEVEFFMLTQHTDAKSFLDDMMDRTFVNKFKMRSLTKNFKPVVKTWTMKYTIFIDQYSVIGCDRLPMDIEIERADNLSIGEHPEYKLHKNQHYPHKAFGIIFQRHGVQILDEYNKVRMKKTILVAKGVAVNDARSKFVQKKYVDKQKH